MCFYSRATKFDPLTNREIINTMNNILLTIKNIIYKCIYSNDDNLGDCTDILINKIENLSFPINEKMFGTECYWDILNKNLLFEEDIRLLENIILYKSNRQ